jgi:hypothetical protein
LTATGAAATGFAGEAVVIDGTGTAEAAAFVDAALAGCAVVPAGAAIVMAVARVLADL